MGSVVRLMRNALQRSRFFLLSIMLVIVCSIPVWGATNACTDFVVDGSFPDSSAPFSFWSQSSTNMYTLICSIPTCTPEDPTFAPNSQSWWAWFGPGIMPETASLGRNITIPVGIAQLQFYLWNKSPFGTVTEVFNVRMDNDPTPLFSTYATDTAYNAGYTLVTLDVSPYADGMPHLLGFEAQIDFNANFHIDDIARAPNETFINYNPTSKAIIRKNNLLQPVIDNTLISQEIRGQNSITNQDKDILVNLSGAASEIAIRGGFGCDLADNSGGLLTAVRSLTISSGRVVAENMVTLGGTVVPGLVIKGDGSFVAKNVVLR